MLNQEVTLKSLNKMFEALDGLRPVQVDILDSGDKDKIYDVSHLLEIPNCHFKLTYTEDSYGENENIIAMKIVFPKEQRNILFE
jgi:hypothetical protein